MSIYQNVSINMSIFLFHSSTLFFNVIVATDTRESYSK